VLASAVLPSSVAPFVVSRRVGPVLGAALVAATVATVGPRFVAEPLLRLAESARMLTGA
jgi:hypothetical protein